MFYPVTKKPSFTEFPLSFCFNDKLKGQMKMYNDIVYFVCTTMGFICVKSFQCTPFG